MESIFSEQRGLLLEIKNDIKPLEDAVDFFIKYLDE